jgi:hypothetical protein
MDRLFREHPTLSCHPRPHQTRQGQLMKITIDWRAMLKRVSNRGFFCLLVPTSLIIVLFAVTPPNGVAQQASPSLEETAKSRSLRKPRKPTNTPFICRRRRLPNKLWQLQS